MIKTFLKLLKSVKKSGNSMRKTPVRCQKRLSNSDGLKLYFSFYLLNVSEFGELLLKVDHGGIASEQIKSRKKSVFTFLTSESRPRLERFLR